MSPFSFSNKATSLVSAEQIATKLSKYGTSLLGLRRSDVWLACYPRSGSTWIRFILCNLLSIAELGGQEVDYHRVEAMMPSIGRSNLFRPWAYSTLPRFVKTHQPYRPLLFALPKRVVYVLRDPRDAVVSYYHLRQNTLRDPVSGNFSDFIRHEKYGMEAYLKHYCSWLPRITAIVRYENMVKDPITEVKEALCALNISIPDPVVEQAIELSRFGRLREIQRKSGIPESRAQLFVKPDLPIAREGKTKRWAEYFSEEDVAYYKDLCRRYGFERY